MRTLSGIEVSNEAHALALAQAELDRRVGREVTMWAVANGDARLRPGAWAEVDAPAPEVSGRYVVTTATHVLDERRGFVSEISSEAPAPRARRSALRTSLGIVVDVADPAALGRVRVSLPSIADLETDWLEVLLPAAGQGKGVIALPAPGDRVLVLLGAQEVSQAIVLGGLYGETAPPDSGVEAGEVVRYTITTSSGQRVILSDDARTTRLEDGNGNAVELGPSGVHVDAVVDVEVAAPGKRIVFKAAAIDFEQA
jgi:phage baseplate assembly protein V